MARGTADSSSRSLESGTARATICPQRLSQDLAAVEAITKLTLSYSEEVLTCVPDGFKGCTVCNVENAKSLVVRALSATRCAYLDLPDFAQTGRLMAIIASHTGHVTEKAEVDWCIGNVAKEKPYVCTIAVPVCRTGSECGRVAAQKIQAYIDGILEGAIRPNPTAADLAFSGTPIPTTSTPQSQSFRSSNEGGQSDYFGDLSFADTSFETSDSDNARLHTVGTTAFVGRPNLQLDDPPKRGQLSCMVYSSTWPKLLLPSPSKNEADDAIDYCRIAACHELPILGSADYRCAVCPDVVAAGSLVHRPIAFVRKNSRGHDQLLRQLIMKLFQFVNGRWNCSSVNSALGSESDAHIFDYVVPICEGRTVCEEVARAAAREFIQKLLPSGMKPIFPGLDPDTDLKVFEDFFEDDFEWEQGCPQLLVCKLSSDCLMTDEPSHENDSTDPSPISPLRQWYEANFSEDFAKYEELRRMGYNPLDEDDGSESDAMSEIDESSVWIYVRNDLCEEAPLSQYSTESRQSRSERDAAKKVERHLLFWPMMSFDFWLINEAIGNLGAHDDSDSDMGSIDEGPSQGRVCRDDASSVYSGDTEICQRDSEQS